MAATRTTACSTCGADALAVKPHALRDSWSRTFYEPLLVKNNAAALLGEIPAGSEATAELDCSLQPIHQFDQVGLFVAVSDDCFVKAGLEYADGKLHLSVVVTNNGFSDWSTQIWREWDGTKGSVHLRLSKLLRVGGPCLLVEVDGARGLGREEGANGPAAAAAPGCGAALPRWDFVRIAPVAASRDAVWRVGPFAACPIAAGMEATFRHFSLGSAVEPSHAADASSMV